MKQTKYINSEGLAFSESDDMQKLREYVKEGWVLENFTPCGYKLRKKQPQNITYALDYQKEVDEEYFSFFEESGWTYVCSGTNQMHFFSAPEGTDPIHTEKMSKLPKGTMIVNTCRGGIIDGAVLAKLITSEHISTAGIDVLEHEPPEAGNPLIGLEIVIMTPHPAYNSVEAEEQMQIETAKNVIRAINGEKSLYVVNGLD